MARRRVNATKIDIIKTGMRMYLEKGYSHTSIKAIGDELELSTGNITFYFPTKEHLLAVLVKILCRFQSKLLQRIVNEGATSLLAVCLEMATMAVACEKNEAVKEFFLSSYTHPMTLEIIRESDIDRAKNVFGEYCEGWDDKRYAEAETLVSGIEYATLMTTEASAPIDVRIAGATNAIMLIYNVPEDVRNNKIEKVLALDYFEIGRSVMNDFIKYVETIDEKAIDELLNS